MQPLTLGSSYNLEIKSKYTYSADKSSLGLSIPSISLLEIISVSRSYHPHPKIFSCTLEPPRQAASLFNLEIIGLFRKDYMEGGCAAYYVSTQEISEEDEILKEKLVNWIAEAPANETESRRLAAIRLDYYKKSPTLHLNNLGLSSLPDIFTHPKFSNHLHHLDISSNELTELPNSLSSLPYLLSLYLHDNKLEELPSSLETLQNLSFLSFFDNPKLILTPKWKEEYGSIALEDVEYQQAFVFFSLHQTSLPAEKYL